VLRELRVRRVDPMWAPFPNAKVEVQAHPDEDCRGHLLVGTALAIIVEAVVLCGVVGLYELFKAWAS
jgi:hypothetical protein